MGEIAEDMISGACCSLCGTYFKKEHGYPVLCASCWRDTKPKDRKAMAVQRAIEKEL